MEMHFRQNGQSLSEYSFVMALVAVSCIGGLTILGNNLSISFSSMLPTPRAVTASIPQSGTGTVSGTALNLQNGSDNSGTIKLNGSKVSKELLREYSEIVLTAGSLGDEKVLYYNSTKLVEFAQKFAETEPEFFNHIVKLGLVGKKMGQSMTKYQTQPDSLNNTYLKDVSVDYDRAWEQVHTSPEYARLSIVDKDLVRRLVDGSINLADVVLTQQGAVVNAGTEVDKNSDEIIVCGQFEKCKKNKK